MARRRKLAPEQELRQYRERLMEAFELWGEIKMYGCSDPAYPDGQNMNLVKNHIMYFRFKIAETCMLKALDYPPEYNLSLPPQVPAGYMASLDQTERVEKLRAMGNVLTTKIGDE